MRRIISISKLPYAGLGNKLFAWASGLVFSNVNHCTHITLGMTRLHPGHILRGETSWRFYFGYFKNESLLPLGLITLLRKKYFLNQKDASHQALKSGAYIFSEIPHWSNEFVGLREHRDLIRASFMAHLTHKIEKKIASHSIPLIAVHIRMGDFRELKEHEDFDKVGGVRTPLSYFIQVINQLRDFLGQKTPITVFSDGKDVDLAPILSMPGVCRVQSDYDIVHLALMSKSKIIVMSAGSTFSHWAGFLSDGVLIKHYQHLNSSIRPNEINQVSYEGGLPPNISINETTLLYRNLDQLKNSFISE